MVLLEISKTPLGKGERVSERSWSAMAALGMDMPRGHPQLRYPQADGSAVGCWPSIL